MEFINPNTNNAISSEENENNQENLNNGLCPECNKLNTGIDWCNQCNAKRFQQDFPNWTSGNKYIDKFIQESQLNARYNEEVLEWIPYNRLSDIKYIAKGGFSTVYKAIWLDGQIQCWDYKKKQWNRDRIRLRVNDNGMFEMVAIKSLNKSSNVNEEFLNEWKIHFNCYKTNPNLVPLFGFTQNPNNLDYMIVMEFAYDGSLKNSLKCHSNYSNWCAKFYILSDIISGLGTIHESDLVHCDLHDGNILCSYNHYIGDLGLCKPIDYFQNKSNKDIYGVVPFMAPEVLRGKPFTPASDMYSFAMIMWELTSGVPPFDDRACDGLQLSLSICRGERPEIIEGTPGTPQCYIDLMKKCWDPNPLQRPTASEVNIIIKNWYSNMCYDEKNIQMHLEKIKNEQLRIDIEEFWKANKALKEKQNNNSESSNSKPITKSHPQAYNISQSLDFTEKLNDILEQEEVESGISQSIDILNQDISI